VRWHCARFLASRARPAFSSCCRAQVCARRRCLARPARALHGHRHPGRHGDATQLLPALIHRTEAPGSGRTARSARCVALVHCRHGRLAVLAPLVDAAILVLAAAAFHCAGRSDVGRRQGARKLLNSIMGAPSPCPASTILNCALDNCRPTFASSLFGIALLSAGQGSTFTGTTAGHHRGLLARPEDSLLAAAHRHPHIGAGADFGRYVLVGRARGHQQRESGAACARTLVAWR
jgi:hypothetical protein